MRPARRRRARDGGSWRLLTTLDVADAAGVAETVRLYRLRWRIEEIFRLKADDMRLEDTQVQDAGRLFTLVLVGLAAATRTLQLVDARWQPATGHGRHRRIRAAGR